MVKYEIDISKSAEVDLHGIVCYTCTQLSAPESIMDIMGAIDKM